MKKFTKILSLLLCLAMIFSFAACAGKTDDSATTTEETVPADTTPINITTLKGPTGMGMAKLISDKNAQYNISIATAATEIAPLIIKGEADIAACPLNLAAAIYKKTGGKVKMIAINTLGVLSILENGESIKNVADLKGKKIGATGQSATPEYVLNYILEANGIDPKKDVEITYYTDHAELATLMATGKIDIAMLPEPNVTTVMAKNSSVRKALRLRLDSEQRRHILRPNGIAAAYRHGVNCQPVLSCHGALQSLFHVIFRNSFRVQRRIANIKISVCNFRGGADGRCEQVGIATV